MISDLLKTRRDEEIASSLQHQVAKCHLLHQGTACRPPRGGELVYSSSSLSASSARVSCCSSLRLLSTTVMRCDEVATGQRSLMSARSERTQLDLARRRRKGRRRGGRDRRAAFERCGGWKVAGGQSGSGAREVSTLPRQFEQLRY